MPDGPSGDGQIEYGQHNGAPSQPARQSTPGQRNDRDTCEEGGPWEELKNRELSQHRCREDALINGVGRRNECSAVNRQHHQVCSDGNGGGGQRD